MRFDQHQIVTRLGTCLFLAASWISAAVAGDRSDSVTKPSDSPAVSDVVLNSNSFEIPFNIAPVGQTPVEVQLYVAGGIDLPPTSQWRLVDRQPPDARRFFVAGVPDGTYWFAIQTVAANAGYTGSDAFRPELRVIVDTSQPSVTLNADADASGRITAKFTIDDATEVRQVTLHYVTDTTRQWQTGSLQRTHDGGQLDVQPDDQWTQCSLRLRVVDQAGNETIANQMVKRPRVATATTTRFASGANGLPYGFNPAGGFNPAPGFNPAAGPTLNAGPSLNASPLSQSSPVVELPPPASAEQISNDFNLPPPIDTTKPADPPKRPKTPAEAMRPLNSPISPSIPSGSPSTTSELNPPQNGSSPMPETNFQTETIPAPTPQRDSAAPSITTPPRATATSRDNAANSLPGSALTGPSQNPDMIGPSHSYAAPSDPSASYTPPPSRVSRSRPATDEVNLEKLAALSPVRYSDSLEFSLDYEIEAIGGRGVSDVELYGSVDGGETWTRWGEDPDRATPFDIQTNGPGTFAFCIVVVATNGLASPRPLPGDSPDIVVVVDETAPQATITGARYGEGDRSGSLVISYDCIDDHLLARPITLAFSDSVEGPWTTIAAGLRNESDYVWPADPQLPRQIYLRLDAADQAGNIGTYILDKPIDTQGLAPRARIRAFRPISAPQ